MCIAKTKLKPSDEDDDTATAIRFELESMSHILCIEVVNSWSDGDSGM